ncbi:MAG: mechanosensitive ion channel [Candidatus Heimdallarchaeota archaeon]|nr:mechanosensitive ion channel [Candidatus Heimdallarchaeota archaeon]
MVIAQIQLEDIFLQIYTFLLLISPMVLSVLIIFACWIFWGLLIRKIRHKLTPAQYNALKTLGRATILLFGLLWLGGEEFFIAAAALLGTAIGFASSSTIGNFISGLYLLVTNPFNVGDYVILPNLKVEGIIEEISINYTNILTPEGIHVIIANQKLLGTIIKNTEITIPQEAVDKGKITWKDHENDSFDSLDDVVDILKGFRTKYASNEDQKYYLYPLEVKLNPDKYLHSKIKIALANTCKEFSSQTDSEISWFMKDRSIYQLNLILANPYKIFDLKSDILGFLEEQIENIAS